MKKFIAILLAVSMIMAFALTASAAETTLADLDCSGWWTAHSEGVEVTEEGVTITYTSTTYENAADNDGVMQNWFGPLWVLYTNDEAKIGVLGEGAYAEYWVHRVDNYGWIGALNRWSPEADLAAAGITITAVDSRTDGWANFAADLKAGITCTLTAKIDGSNAIVTYDANGIYTTITLPVDTSKPIYLSLTGEQAKMTNIKVVTPDPEPAPDPEPTPDPEPDVTPDPENPKDGDSISVFVALMAVSVVGAAVVLKKKEF